MEQTGFLFKQKDTDYILGFSSPLQGVKIKEDSNWVEYAPSEEKQYSISFDTMCCSTFSALNVLETFFNFLLKNNSLSENQVKFCKDNGYIENDKFNFSDRYSATSNRTTPQGQYIQLVWDDIRVNGLLPEKDLPFGGNNQAEYLDIKNITEEMRTKARKFLSVMIESLNYEFVPVITGVEINEALKESPVQVAVTKTFPRHAIALLSMTTEMETYPPFVRQRNRDIAYCLKPVIKIKKEEVKKYKYFSAKEVLGLKDELVVLLDKARELAGIPFVINSGYRTAEHNDEIGGVENSSHTKGLGVDLRARNSTEHYLITKALLDAGFKRISRKYPFHIHADLDNTKPQNVLF